MTDSLFPEWVRDKDLSDALHHVLVAFDPRRPGYTPAFQKGALILVKDVLGLGCWDGEREALEAEVLASPSATAAPVYGPPLAGS